MRGLVFSFSIGLLIVLTSCSTLPPVQTGKKGFFDGLDSRGRPVARDELEATQNAQPSFDEKKIESIRQFTSTWVWPLENPVVTSGFGTRGRGFHEGVDLRAFKGTPVYSVGGGQVVYAARKIKGYGRMVVLRHEGGLLSVYAHLSEMKVKRGQRVIKGQLIGKSGATGRVRGPHLHFEIRRGISAVDPERVLPDTVQRREELASSDSVIEEELLPNTVDGG